MEKTEGSKSVHDDDDDGRKTLVKKKQKNRFSLSFYYRVGDQLINQAQLYRQQGNMVNLSTTLDRYCRLISKMPQHPSYLTYSAKEKLHHNKICQEFLKELEILGHDAQKAEYHGGPQTSCRSVSEEDHGLASVITAHSGTSCSRLGSDRGVNVHCVTQSSPSPVLSCIQIMPQAAHVSHITTSDLGHAYSQPSYQDLHISVRLMEDFLELARDNTNNDLETCGVLGAFLKNGTFYVTTLIIPKQETTSSSCQALNEEEIYAIQSEHSLFPVGWIHTHPSQTCFMSSIDLHTQYSYQIMLPEAVAIVMAPTDPTRSYGIFRLCDPGGTTVLKECHETGFHPHQEPSDGSPIYEDCSNVYLNPNLRFEIFDLRC